MAKKKKAKKKSLKRKQRDALTGELDHVLDRLYVVIDSRKGADPDTSYTARLFSRGRQQIAKKLGEEAVEALIEGIRGDRPKLVAESADMLYHLLTLWAATGVKPKAVWTELARREGLSGIAGAPSGDQGEDSFLGCLSFDGKSATEKCDESLLRDRVQPENGGATAQRGIHGERRVLGGGNSIRVRRVLRRCL